MHTIELFQLSVWTKNAIEKKQLNQHYQNLINTLQQNTRQNQQQVPFAPHLETLKNYLIQVDISELSAQQYSVLEDFNIVDSIGIRAVEILDDAAYKNAIDQSNFQKIVNNLKNNMNTGLAKINNIYTALLNIHNVNEVNQIETHEASAKIYFKGKMGVGNIVDLESRSKEWNLILRGVVLPMDGRVEDLRITNFEKGSLLVTIAGVAGTITAVAVCFKEILNCREKLIDVEIKKLQLQNMKDASNKDYIDKAIEPLDQLINEKMDEIPQQVRIAYEKEIGKKLSSENLSNFNRSISYLIDFLEKDGSIDFYLPKPEIENEEEQSEDYKRKLEMFKEIRQLEDKLLKIEGPEVK